MPQVEPYTVVRAEGSVNIVCGICNRQFETLKGWRIHTSRMHKQDGFCARCGHYLLLPPSFTVVQKTAAMELHALDWCPRACATVMKKRQVKRHRLNLVGRKEDTHHLFVPAEKFFLISESLFQTNNTVWHSPCGRPVTACFNKFSTLYSARPVKWVSRLKK
uniref:Zinc finger, C2H2 type family protein n=1 Tax=Brugia malayi TaxID=6279 RepID=A8P820_BRUMA